MKSIVCFVICALLTLSGHAVAGTYEEELQKISTDFGTALEHANLKTVATVSFKNLDNKETNLGKLLAEEISVNLVNQNKNISVVDRANLDRIMQEQKLTEEGLVDPENTKKLKLAGIDAIIFGTIVPFEGTYRVDLKAIATDTAKVVAAVRGSITRTADLDNMMGVAKIQSTLAPGTPQNAQASDSLQTSNESKVQKVYDIDKVVITIKSVEFFKKTGRVRVMYSVTHKDYTGAVDSFVYHLINKGFQQMPGGGYPQRPDMEIAGGATDDSGNSYKMQVPPEAAADSSPELPPNSSVAFQVEYQMATNGASEIQLPTTINFWFEFGVCYKSGRFGNPTTISKLSVVNYPFDRIH